jgi:hypothetical protein
MKVERESLKMQRTFNRKERKGLRRVRKGLTSASSAGCFFVFFAVSEFKHLDKTLLSRIDNQYKVVLCQDLPGATVMKFKKFCMKIFRQDFLYLNCNMLQNFCQDLSGLKKRNRDALQSPAMTFQLSTFSYDSQRIKKTCL